MLQTLGSLFFYARFGLPFTTIGYARRVALRPAAAFDFRGQTWWVTGASGGIGRAIALGALRAGASVHALARDPAKLQELRFTAGIDGARLQPVVVDLSSVAAVRALAERAPQIDVLVHNVGVMLHQHRQTAEGVEASFATNVLAPFAHTAALTRSGALSPRSLIISVSSGGAYGARLDLHALESLDPEGHDGFMAYAQHKRAQIELTRHWNAPAEGPRALVMHPGWVDTDGVRSALPRFRRVLKRFLRSPEQGADTVLWLAASRPEPDPSGGIWLDRHRDPEHAFAISRGGVGADQLAAFLDRRLARISGA